MTTLIITHGDITQSRLVQQAITSADSIIAADGGANHCNDLGIVPDVLIGDLDSAQADIVKKYEKQGVHIVRHPVRKDETDFELAVRLATEEHSQYITVLGGIGDRLDHSIANLLLGAHLSFDSMHITFVEGDTETTLIHQGTDHKISGTPGNIVSLIPLGGDVHGVTSSGLEYPLVGEVLIFGSTRGVSNTLTKNRAIVRHESGLLMCVHIHQSPV